MATISQNIKQASYFLKSGQLIGMPTETVYGLAGNALLESTILQIFKVKDRPKFDPLILHFSKYERCLPFVKPPSEKLYKLIEYFSPGPITFLLDKTPLVNDLITANLPRVAVRFPKHFMAQVLLKDLDFPVAAPSANPFGYVSPTTAVHVNNQLGHRIPFILDGGSCQVGLESTILGEEKNEIIVYRKGGVPIETIEKVVGKIRVLENSSSQPSAPGMLQSHYAPSVKTQLLLNGQESNLLEDPQNAILFFKKKKEYSSYTNAFFLSKDGSTDEAAIHLFSTLRELDNTMYTNIYVELAPETGLGRAINDRLKRAACG